MAARDTSAPAASEPQLEPLEQPFPLRRLYRRRFLPAFAGFLAALLLLVGLTAKIVTESIYLELAERRAQTIARAVSATAPAAWQQLMQGRSARELSGGKGETGLSAAFAAEVRELALADLKVYDLDRRVLFATDAAKIGTREDGAPLRSVIESGRSVIDRATAANGSAQYELYVPLKDAAGNLRAVFELYEPVGYLNELLLQAALPALAVPGSLLLVLALALDRLVRAAQRDIDMRTARLNALRRRIETFVSRSAVAAAKKSGGREPIASRKLVTTLLYSDVRGFTEFSETREPEKVVAFLNAIMGAQVAIISGHGGEVDKMIGDAILARFHGRTGPRRAIAAARDILRAVEHGAFPRKVGIGIYRGRVILGAIGPDERRDFTVIGDPVNIAARLCAAARAGEVVADAELTGQTFGPLETLRVKGRNEALNVRRWHVDTGSATSA
ncbi:MAG: adenylate/guanylate cyclase domain-containing protein [Alphaproteobacteria bacterium]|nr:MAG: adenylate/guanylate cyclase domain-containing protein [Alphaproteobacteria bacterium]